LLRHVNDSLAAVYEGMTAGYIGLGPAAQTADVPAGGLIATFRNRAVQLLAASATAGDHDIDIADRRLPSSIVTAVGAVEIAVHGWDIATACGHPRPIPPALATGIVKIMPLVITDAARNGRFAAPVELHRGAGEHDIGPLGPARVRHDRPFADPQCPGVTGVVGPDQHSVRVGRVQPAPTSGDEARQELIDPVGSQRRIDVDVQRRRPPLVDRRDRVDAVDGGLVG